MQSDKPEVSPETVNAVVAAYFAGIDARDDDATIVAAMLAAGEASS